MKRASIRMEILVIRFSSLGDVVLASGALRAIGRTCPDARVTFLTKPMYRPITQFLERPVNTPPLNPDRLFISAWRAVRRTRFDWIFDLHGSVRSVALSSVLRTRHRRRIDKHTARRRRMVKHKIGLDRPLSLLRTYHDVLEPLAVDSTWMQPRSFLSGEEAAQARTLRSAGSGCLGIGWGARWPTKAVPSRTWGSLLSLLGDMELTTVRIFGTDNDRAAIESFIHEQKAFPSERLHAECGHDLRAVMVRLCVCDVFVSSDSGLMHLAAALDVPTIGLFGPTHPALGFAPVGPRSKAIHARTWCSPCHRHGAAPCFREHRYCFDELDVPAIADTVRSALTRPWSLKNVSTQE